MRLAPTCTQVSITICFGTCSNINSYTNIMTGRRQTYPPPEFSGGLLGGQMGLGKTLSIISLILSNTARVSRKRPRASRVATQEVKTTLIVTPMSCTDHFNEGKQMFKLTAKRCWILGQNNSICKYQESQTQIIIKQATGTYYQRLSHGQHSMASRSSA
jgi:hypothetical protein